MSAYSDWKCGALSDEEYEAECNKEARREAEYERAIERAIYNEKEDE